MHEFTYEAMVNDLLDIDEEKISYESEANSGEKVKKDVLLNENDELWKEVRLDFRYFEGVCAVRAFEACRDCDERRESREE